MSQAAQLGVELRELRVGQVVPFGPAGHCSGIDKQPVDTPVMLETDGLVSDAQGDTRSHGGPEKALHHYPFEHYAEWRADHPDLAWRLTEAGAFGENLVTLGLDEASVCVGDIFTLGEAWIQVSQARQPCWRLNVRFDNRKMARWVQQSGRTGWYYRVLEPGQIEAGDRLTLVERLEPDWTLANILHYFYVDTLDRSALTAISQLAPLAQRWRDLAARRLQRAAVEDWHGRINTPQA